MDTKSKYKNQSCLLFSLPCLFFSLPCLVLSCLVLACADTPKKKINGETIQKHQIQRQSNKVTKTRESWCRVSCLALCLVLSWCYLDTLYGRRRAESLGAWCREQGGEPSTYERAKKFRIARVRVRARMLIEDKDKGERQDKRRRHRQNIQTQNQDTDKHDQIHDKA
jgi:hypothetical protein